MRKFSLILAFNIVLIATDCFALTDAQQESAKRLNDINIQRLERERIDIIKQHKKQEIEKIRDSRELEEIEGEDDNLDDNGGCVNLKKIVIEGNEIFSDKKIEKKLSKNTEINV